MNKELTQYPKSKKKKKDQNKTLTYRIVTLVISTSGCNVTKAKTVIAGLFKKKKKKSYNS